MNYPGHLLYVEEAANQQGVTDRGLVDQARRLPPLSHLSSLVGQAYESARAPHHRAADLSVAARQLAVLELATVAARAILAKAQSDLSPEPAPAPAKPARPHAHRPRD